MTAMEGEMTLAEELIKARKEQSENVGGLSKRSAGHSCCRLNYEGILPICLAIVWFRSVIHVPGTSFKVIIRHVHIIAGLFKMFNLSSVFTSLEGT